MTSVILLATVRQTIVDQQLSSSGTRVFIVGYPRGLTTLRDGPVHVTSIKCTTIPMGPWEVAQNSGFSSSDFQTLDIAPEVDSSVPPPHTGSEQQFLHCAGCYHCRSSSWCYQAAFTTLKAAPTMLYLRMDKKRRVSFYPIVYLHGITGVIYLCGASLRFKQ
ncbi:hypothetical protein GALMADRAFT_259585 [Galerina marginata CBS 339.88]|uniref:Uncharacterized protein n=1 Tax=Galerina marginata (strain CBS 339.88) TaxID=685588 RepID=A0A067SHQ1_GALM3|nr:hypothetical protein GALMADRAFT_259585 [Galerina marginata CBS 339.88]